MARVAALAAVLAAAVLAAAAGCGGDDDVPACDDAAFGDQSEELYVAIATAQNAQAPGATPAALADLRKGARVLRLHVDAHPPCDDALKAIAADEREALDAIDAAVAEMERGRTTSDELRKATELLGQAEGDLAPPRPARPFGLQSEG